MKHTAISLLLLLMILAPRRVHAGANSIAGPFLTGSGHWNTIPGGGFESPAGPLPSSSSSDDIPGYWYLFTSAETGGAATFDTAAAQVGNSGVRVAPKAFKGAGIALTWGAVTNLLPGKQYVLSGFVNLPNPSGPDVHLYLDLRGTPGNVLVPARLVQGWQFIYGEFTAPATPVGVRASLENTVTTSDVFLVDELAITPLDQFVPPSPAPTPVLAADLLNIDFGEKGTLTKTGPAAIGAGAGDVWNLYIRDLPEGGYRNNGTLAPLLWADGSSSTVGLEIQNAAGAWNNGSTDIMFGDFLYPLTADPTVTLTVTNLPAGVYDVLAYGHGDRPEQSTAFHLTAGVVDYGTRSTAADATWRQEAWVEGVRYVRFTGMYADPVTPLVLQAQKGGGTVGIINGLQLLRRAAVPLLFAPAPGEFTNHVNVAILGAARRSVRYTTDGTDPVATSSPYIGPLQLNAAALVKARLFDGTTAVSDVFSALYVRVYAIDDGITSDWRLQHFGAGYRTDPRAAADADPDLDGATNLQEFGNGTNPLDPLDGFQVGVRAIPSITWHSVSNTVYSVLRKDRLSDTNWVEVQQIRSLGNLTTFSDESVTNQPRYYLIKAIKR